MASASFLQPSKDKLAYEELILDNGMRVVLVSDSTAEKGACSVDVKVGSFSDPTAFPGLAHFLEHMLFYASEKYPVEDEYMKFVVRCQPKITVLRSIVSCNTSGLFAVSP